MADDLIARDGRAGGGRESRSSACRGLRSRPCRARAGRLRGGESYRAACGQPRSTWWRSAGTDEHSTARSRRARSDRRQPAAAGDRDGSGRGPPQAAVSSSCWAASGQEVCSEQMLISAARRERPPQRSGAAACSPTCRRSSGGRAHRHGREVLTRPRRSSVTRLILDSDDAAWRPVERITLLPRCPISPGRAAPHRGARPWPACSTGSAAGSSARATWSGSRCAGPPGPGAPDRRMAALAAAPPGGPRPRLRDRRWIASGSDCGTQADLVVERTGQGVSVRAAGGGASAPPGGAAAASTRSPRWSAARSTGWASTTIYEQALWPPRTKSHGLHELPTGRPLPGTRRPDRHGSEPEAGESCFAICLSARLQEHSDPASAEFAVPAPLLHAGCLLRRSERRCR